MLKFSNLYTAAAKLCNHGSKLDKETAEEVQRDLTRVNIRRIRYMLLATILFELFLIIFHDLLQLIHKNLPNNLPAAYLLLHCGILAAALSGLLIARKVQFNRLAAVRRNPHAINFLTGAVVFTILALVAVINGLDQRFSDSVTVYVAIILMLSVLVMISPPINIAVYTAGYAVFVISMISWQPSETALAANLINGGIVSISAVVISTVFYHSSYQGLVKTVYLHRANRQLEMQSRTDSLTGLANRRHFYAVMEQKMALPETYESCCSILIVDLDHFKKVNDSYGHFLGDYVLKETAVLLKETFKDSGIVMRWGGDEFVVVLFDTPKEKILGMAREVIQRQGSRMLVFNGIETIVTASAGMAELGDFTIEGIDMAIARADNALYAAKKAGRNCVREFAG